MACSALVLLMTEPSNVCAKALFVRGSSSEQSSANKPSVFSEVCDHRWHLGRPRSPPRLSRAETHTQPTMADADTGHDYDSTYEEVHLSEMTFEEAEGMYYWECPCGDLFEISQAELDEGQDIAHCPSCSLTLRVLLPPPPAPAETTDPEVKGVVQALTGLSTKDGGE